MNVAMTTKETLSKCVCVCVCVGILLTRFPKGPSWTFPAWLRLFFCLSIESLVRERTRASLKTSNKRTADLVITGRSP
jgi:hypothetical protein